MASSIGQYCINVEDLERAVDFYGALGLPVSTRTEIPQAWEAVVAHRDNLGGRLQLAQQKEQELPLDLGTAFWKLYVNTDDAEATFARAVDAGATVESKPERFDRWPVTVGFVRDLDGYLVEIVQRHPWPDGSPSGGPWLGQYCLNVTDLDRTIAFYELLGLQVTSRTEIAEALEAIVEQPGAGGKLQLAQQKAGGPIRMGSMWKLYVNVDDCQATHDAGVAAGHPSLMAPARLDRWPVTVAFLGDPDGYQVELVERHPS